MIFKRIFILICALSLAALLGCGSNWDTENPSETIPVYTLPPVIREAEPVVGGELTFPVPQNPVSLNPLKTKNVGLFNLLSLIYEKPIRIDVRGHAEPELVETWETDDGGLEWTFKLREGVQWQMGYGEMTSADLFYTMNQLKSLSVSESNYAYYNNRIAGYSAPDKYTFKLTLTEPGNTALYYMTFPVLCKSYGESVDIESAKPVGTGPYQADLFSKTDRIELSVNTQWWRQPPYIQKLTALCYPDHDMELAAYRQNLFDFLTTSSLTVDTYRKYGETQYVDYLTQHYDCLVPNTKGLFADVNMRLAVAYALDKRDIVAKGLLGHAVVTDFPISPDSYLSPGPAKIFEFNRQNSMELLEQLGYRRRGNDPILKRTVEDKAYELSFELLINGNETYRLDVAKNIAAQLYQCGIDVRIVDVDADEYKRRLEAGNFDIALCSFYLDINPDASYLLESNGAVNYGRFSDDRLDALLAECREAIGEEAMKQAYTHMEDRFLQTMPHIGLYFRTNALLYHTKINIADEFRDRTVFSTISRWYLYVEGQEG